jgi:hypothetical protein
MDQERQHTHAVEGGGGTATVPGVDFKTLPLQRLLAIRDAGFTEWLDQAEMPTPARENIVAFVDALYRRLKAIAPTVDDDTDPAG